ncbi:hypothetical protein SteCoe_33773 [Stentor coeruleus]|uniref:Bacteriophage T5 Orf172 DNA-binding domain-containing protein n=1 Tax=Stentor coeruleus TaxID=5963 RepID=A0A1R2AVZ4_9CILI|nr:hypothetical protein SteCoe_33773 [Stentor coeruleus]
MTEKDISNIIYKLPDDLLKMIRGEKPEKLEKSEKLEKPEKLEKLEKSSLTKTYTKTPEASNSTIIDSQKIPLQKLVIIKEKPLREQKIKQICKEFGLENCIRKISTPISIKDEDGFIYAYYTKSYPGMYKVGRSKYLPTRRIHNQEKSNKESYTNQESFKCSYNRLVEACIHIEIKDFRVKLDKKQDGYTEWFRIEWGPLRKVIRNVINAVMQLLLQGLIVFNYTD